MANSTFTKFSTFAKRGMAIFLCMLFLGHDLAIAAPLVVSQIKKSTDAAACRAAFSEQALMEALVSPIESLQPNVRAQVMRNT